MFKKPKILIQDYLFILMLIFFIGATFYHNYIWEDTYESVGKVINFKRLKGSGMYVEFIYFVNQEEMSSSNQVDVNSYNKYIGKYYLIEISSKNPETSRMFLDKEIYNFDIIKKSGFE